MGRIIPYIMENKKCSKPPTSKILVAPKDISWFMESSTWIPRLPRDIICTSSSLLAMAALLSHRKMLSRKCHCWEPVSNRKHQERKSFERLEQWFILKTVCKLSPSFLLCGCLFASFCYQSQSLKLFGGCLGLEKKGEGEAHMKVCHSFLGIWSWVGTLASLPIMIGAYQPVILTTNGCEMMWQGVSQTWVSHQTWVCRNGHNQNLWFPELQDYDPCPSQNYAPRGLCKLTHQITYELNFLLVTT